MEIPNEWPNKIKESYEPIRILGKGGFASVVLARNKNNKQQKVAIKVVGCSNDNADDNNNNNNNNNNNIQAVIAAASLYAQREIEILKQIHHPNIVKLFNHWIAGVDDDDNNSYNKTAAVLILEYVKGPTVESLLRYGGALSTIFSRIIIAQMMDAISYLHYRAVLHRDIKPDNIIISGALSNDDTIWDNPNNANNSNNNNDDNDNDNDLDEQCHHHSSYSSSGGTTTSTTQYKKLLLKWKVTIIDFGFARALTPNDVEKPSQDNRLKLSKNASYHDIYNNNNNNNSKNKNKNKNNNNDELSSSSSKRLRKRISRGILNVLDFSFHSDSNDLSSSQRSATHKMIRTMSTLGNRNYAAPEIINKVRQRNHREEKKEKEKEEQQKQQKRIIITATSTTNSATSSYDTKTTETISNYVADYGLLVDSYSMGHTIRYMMTGVQPGTSIDDAIQKQQNIENGLLCCRTLLSCFSNNNNSNNKKQQQKRSVRYRRTEDLPKEVYVLIKSLTEQSQRNRISIRKARRTVPWISDVFLSSSQQQQEQEQQLSSSPSNKEDDDNNNNNNNDDEKKEEQKQQEIISTPPTTTMTISTPSSHHVVSEEQLHSLNQICYLPLATAAIETVAASNSTTTSSTKLDTDTNTDTSTNTDKASIVQIDSDDIYYYRTN